MGAGFSGLADDSNVCDSYSTCLGDIHESCISSILANMDPPEICQLARVNRAFFSASSADFVWESKLPANYRFLMDKVLGKNSESLTKKEIYARLCRPNCFDGVNKEVWLDRITGNCCISISSKALKITGNDDRRYWIHIPTDESRFPTVSYLQQIWWVEIVGEFQFQFQFLPGTYSLFFKLHLGKPSNKFGKRVCNTDQVHGWNIKPVRFQLSTSNGQTALSQC